MKVRGTRRILRATGALVLGAVGAGLTVGQVQPEQTVPMAQEVFINVPALGRLPVDEFMDTMGMFSAALSMTCSDCHVSATGGWAEYAEETPLKQTARRMIAMVNRINRENFGGGALVTCYSCHRGDDRPHVVPDLAIQYSLAPEDPHRIFFSGQASPGVPTVDQIFEKYIEALGGRERLASVTSFVANGTYSGFDTELQPVPVEVFARVPDRRTVIVQTPYGDSVRVYDGQAGWISAPDKPLPLLPLTGGNLDGARTEAILSFPAHLREAFSRWRVGLPSLIGGREVQVVQGTNSGQTPVNLYFDAESGLLVRVVRYVETAVGSVPTQIDYEDYREVSGVRMPFRWTMTWTNGQSTTALTDIQPDVPIDPARFSRPGQSSFPAFQN